jgi:hypothetical protein
MLDLEPEFASHFFIAKKVDLYFYFHGPLWRRYMLSCTLNSLTYCSTMGLGPAVGSWPFLLWGVSHVRFDS